ncbi:hypothetical protein V1289_004752 [Bradyrhizobium sp. AZCC 2289]|jgi:hypothetical protein
MIGAGFSRASNRMRFLCVSGDVSRKIFFFVSSGEFRSIRSDFGFNSLKG